MAKNFLLNTLLSVSVNIMSSASSIILPGGVSVCDVVLDPGVVGVVSEKVTLAFVGVDLERVALAFDIVFILFIELFDMTDLLCLFTK